MGGGGSFRQADIRAIVTLCQRTLSFFSKLRNKSSRLKHRFFKQSTYCVLVQPKAPAVLLSILDRETESQGRLGKSAAKTSANDHRTMAKAVKCREKKLPPMYQATLWGSRPHETHFGCSVIMCLACLHARARVCVCVRACVRVCTCLCVRVCVSVCFIIQVQHQRSMHNR